MDQLARIRLLRDNGASLFEAKSIVNRELMDAAIDAATTVEDIKLILRKLMTRISL